MKKQWIILAAALMSIVLVLAACGTGNDSSSEPEKESGDKPKNTADDKTYKIGVTQIVPFYFTPS